MFARRMVETRSRIPMMCSFSRILRLLGDGRFCPKVEVFPGGGAAGEDALPVRPCLDGEHVRARGKATVLNEHAVLAPRCALDADGGGPAVGRRVSQAVHGERFDIGIDGLSPA